MIVAILQARCSSSRLPGKVLKPLLGKPWMLRRLHDVGCYSYIVEHAGDPAGFLLLDRLRAGRYEVSIFVDSKKQHLGIASGALDLAARLNREVAIEAEVLPQNAASAALFAASGYNSNGCGRYILEPRL